MPCGRFGGGHVPFCPPLGPALRGGIEDNSKTIFLISQ